MLLGLPPQQEVCRQLRAHCSGSSCALTSWAEYLVHRVGNSHRWILSGQYSRQFHWQPLPLTRAAICVGRGRSRTILLRKDKVNHEMTAVHTDMQKLIVHFIVRDNLAVFWPSGIHCYMKLGPLTDHVMHSCDLVWDLLPAWPPLLNESHCCLGSIHTMQL